MDAVTRRTELDAPQQAGRLLEADPTGNSLNRLCSKEDDVKRMAVVVFAGLALLAGAFAGCGSAADRVNDDRGSRPGGPDYFLVEEVRVVAPAPVSMLDDVVITAPAPEGLLEEVVVGARRRPADAGVLAGSAAPTGSGSREL